ncbi:transcriptional regulator [Arsukibacterium sp.]|uniref:P-II family nitrogen regulator n=1 Tax=Arsukibacterium sp. TaxID=1977258 RepID=UPI001BD23487|nr:transcriptional regulator [Arsukibacterium sp.]
MKFSAIVVIAPDELEEQAISQAKKAGATGITILSGRGIAADNRKTFLGMTFEGSQTVLLMVVAKHLSLPILKSMQALLLDDGNSRGIAFTVPIDHLTGLDMSQVLKFEQHLREQND